MIIEHELDRKQRFGNGHQLGVIERAAAVDVCLDGLAVAADMLAGFLGVNQAQCIFNAGEHADQLGHVRRIGVILADAQIKGVFDAQNVFFDDRGDAFQQSIVPSKQTALGMRDFFFVRHDFRKFENLVDLFERRRSSCIAGHEIQQLLGQANRGKMADFSDAAVIEEIDFLIDFDKALLQRIVAFDAAFGNRGQQR